MKSPIFGYKQLLPTLILTGCSLYTIVNPSLLSADYYYLLEPGHYGAFAAVSLCMVSYFFFRAFYKYILLFTLLLGLCGFIYFLPNQEMVSLIIGVLKISCNLLSLALVLLTYALNYKRANYYLLSLITPKEIETAEQHREEIERFLNRFRTKSTEELTQILTENKLVPEALEATL